MALGYKVAIFNVWWRRGEVDTRFFSSKADQKTYFDSKTLYFNDLNNFNINDNITTVITFRDASGRSIDDLLKCNYAIVKDSSNNYRYFFITAIKQDAGGQVQCTLDLDDIQNNLIGNVSNLGHVYLKRWTGANIIDDNGNDVLPSNSAVSFVKTDDNPALYNKATYDIKIKFTKNAAIDNWLFENVACWRYIFVNQNSRLCAPSLDNIDDNKSIYVVSTCSNVIGDKHVRSSYYSVCGPRYKKNATKRIYIKFNYTFQADTYTYYEMLEDTNLDQFFWLEGDVDQHTTPSTTVHENNYPVGTYGIEEKISNLPPFTITSTAFENMEIDNDGDLIINCSTTIDKYDTVVSYGAFNSLLYGLADKLRFYTIDQIPKSNQSKANNLKAIISGYYLSDTTFDAECSNPLMKNAYPLQYFQCDKKLLDANYTKLRIRIAAQTYEYNPLAYDVDFSDTKLYFKYSEILKVGKSKIYLRLVESGFYTKPQENDYTGLIASLDLSEPILSNQWQDYLANHKNYDFQLGLNYTYGALKGLTRAGSAAVSGGQSGGGYGAAAAFGFSVLDSTLALGYQYYNDLIFKDNIVSAPDSLANANGDPYFNYEVSGIGPKLDFLQADDYMLELAYFKLMRVGVPYNIIVNDMSFVFESHTNYDAISFDINKLTNLEISEKEYERLKSKLGSLNRYWYSDDVDYTELNYFKGV